MSIFTRLARELRPPRIVAVSRRPAGYLAVGNRGLHRVVAWGMLEDDTVVGLVAGRGGLRSATGWRFHGYLPGAALSGLDVQHDPPNVTVPPADLAEAIADARDMTTATQAGIYGRLKIAAQDEWGQQAFVAFHADPEQFLTRYWQRLAEHGHPAELHPAERAFLASLTAPDAERTKARTGSDQTEQEFHIKESTK